MAIAVHGVVVVVCSRAGKGRCRGARCGERLHEGSTSWTLVTSFETPNMEPELPPKHHLPKHGRPAFPK